MIDVADGSDVHVRFGALVDLATERSRFAARGAIGSLDQEATPPAPRPQQNFADLPGRQHITRRVIPCNSKALKRSRPLLSLRSIRSKSKLQIKGGTPNSFMWNMEGYGRMTLETSLKILQTERMKTLGL